jgi:uncharacterized protein with von Willebrand factor type A (vWA) domain
MHQRSDKVNEAKKRIREFRLQKYVRILASRYNIALNLIDKDPVLGENFSGYSDAKKTITLKTEISKDEEENLLLHKGVSMHEMGHIMFTRLEPWQRKKICHPLMNIISDGRVEEGVARTYPRARAYFFYMNEWAYAKHPIVTRLFSDVKHDTLIFILNTALRTTGAPPLPERFIKHMRRKLKDDFKWLGEKTREAVEASSEEKAAEITAEIQEKLFGLFDEDLPDVSKTPSYSIETKSAGNGLGMPMPTQSDDGMKSLLDQESDFFGGNGEKLKEAYEEIKKGFKEAIKSDASQELQREANEMKTSSAQRDFDSYKQEGSPSMKVNASLDGAPISTGRLEPLARQMVRAFNTVAERGDSWVHSQPRGKLEMHRLPLLYTSKNNPKVFKQKKKKKKTDLSAIILLDSSGSMYSIAETATEAAYCLARALELGRYNVEVVAFGTMTQGHDEDLYGMKSFNQRLIYAKDKFVPRALDGTPLYAGLFGAEKSMQKVKSQRKIVLVVTDGQPNDPEKCRAKIHEMEQKGASVIGILINTDDMFKLFTKSLKCYNISDLPHKLEAVIKETLIEIKNGG